MPQVSIKKLLICSIGFLITVTCTACGTGPAYRRQDYLLSLANSGGIGSEDDPEKTMDELYKWGVIDEEDLEEKDSQLDYAFLKKTLTSLSGDEECLNTLIDKGLIDEDPAKDKNISQAEAEKIITVAVDYINNREFEPSYVYETRRDILSRDDDLQVDDIFIQDGICYLVTGKQENEISYREAQLEEVFSSFSIEDSCEIDLSRATVIPYGEEEAVSYRNEKYQLISSNNHVFNTEGFRVSYTIGRSGIDVHISKDVNGINVYGDLSLSSIKPSFRWTYEEDDLQNCYFRVDFHSTEKIGCSNGRYGNYHLTFRDLDASSFKGMLNSLVEPAKDEVEATIPICKIVTPIPQIPLADLEMDVVIKLYVSGKAELQLYNMHSLGFETRNGAIRFINDTDRDYDAIVQASAKAAMGLNIALAAAGFRLCDVELDGGLRALVKSTLHLYDQDGNLNSSSSAVALSTLMDLSDGNPDVKVCGDVSFYWLMDLIINTSRSKMYALGFTRTYSIMDEDNQVFHNLHHYEDGHFVKKCTRIGRNKAVNMETIHYNRIVLNSYAEVLKRAETFQIEIKGLPQGYSEADIRYESPDPAIARVEGGLITPVSPGSVRIKVTTADGNYEAYVNILVSSE